MMNHPLVHRSRSALAFAALMAAMLASLMIQSGAAQAAAPAEQVTV